ncbi:uncharacterized protein PGTG_20479, partial [Puccinia graminis f. sp. tritici CRL 75-36-700-3]
KDQEHSRVLELLKRAKEKARLLDSKTTPTPTTTGHSPLSTTQEDGASTCGRSVTVEIMIRIEEEEETGGAEETGRAGT